MYVNLPTLQRILLLPSSSEKFVSTYKKRTRLHRDFSGLQKSTVHIPQAVQQHLQMACQHQCAPIV